MGIKKTSSLKKVYFNTSSFRLQIGTQYNLIILIASSLYTFFDNSFLYTWRRYKRK